MFGDRNKHWPESLQRYHELAKARPANPVLQEVRFVVFDTETSGLSRRNSRLLSLAAVSIQDQEIHVTDSIELYVAEEDVGGQEAASIHGLVPQELEHGMSSVDAVLTFLNYVGAAVLVAHHARFDLGVLNRALSTIPGAKVISPWIDTGRLVARFEHGPMSQQTVPRMSLDDVLSHYQLDAIGRHTAAGDTLATAMLFLRILKMAEARGICSLRALLRRW